MFRSLVSIASLMASTLLMMVGFGLMNYMLPVRALGEGWSTIVISVIATGYTIGFTVSCIVTPFFVRRVGHVRVFGALITLLTVGILLCALLVEWHAWFFFRMISGFAIAGAYLIIESWLNERVNNDNRGTLFSVYMITCLVGSIGGQYLVPLGDINSTTLFIVCGVIFSLALLPTALSTAQTPAPIAKASFNLTRLLQRSPIAFWGSLLSGALSGTWGSLGGVYTQKAGLTTAEGATLLAATLAGGAFSQMPIGRLSDRIDRRYVMIGSGVTGVLACLLMTVFGHGQIYFLYAAAFLVGTVLYPVYALNVAHANDRAEPSEYVMLSSGIMILYGAGTVSGPLMGGTLMEYAGPKGLMYFLALAFGLYAGYAFWRMKRRTTDQRDSATDFHAMPIPMQGTEGVATGAETATEAKAI